MFVCSSLTTFKIYDVVSRPLTDGSRRTLNISGAATLKCQDVDT